MTHLTDDPATGRRISNIVFALLAVAALLAAAGTWVSITNYRRSAAALRGIQLEFTDLVITEGDDPTAAVYMRLRNDSDLSVWVGSYEFSLYANNQRVGGSSSSYRASDESQTDAERRQAKTIEQDLEPGAYIDLEFTFDIYYLQMGLIRRVQKEGPVDWQTRASFQTRLPTAHRVEMVGLSATLEEE